MSTVVNNILQPDKALHVYTRLLKFVQQYWLIFGIGTFATICYSLVDSGLFYYIRPILDRGFIAHDPVFLHRLVPTLIIFFVVRASSGLISTYCVTWVGRTIIMRFRQQIFAHLLKLPAEFYDKHSSGTLLSIMLYNVEQLAQASTDSLITLVRESVSVLGLIAVMFLNSWQLTLFFMLIAPMIAVIVKKTNRRLRSISKDVQNMMGDITHVAEESIEGYKIIRTFGGEAYETAKFNNAAKDNRRREMKFILTSATTSPIIQGLAGVVIITTVYFATIHTFAITPGAFVSIIVSMLAILKPMKSLSTVNSNIQRGIAAAESIYGLLDEKTEEDTGTLHMQRCQGVIEFKNISFTYQNNNKPVLNNINLHVKAGETVALVGRSGAGKSTLVNLLPRFYDYQSGLISIDNVDIRSIKLADLRQQIALVSQNIVLFNDTVANNIAYGCFDNTAENAIIHAAQSAHAMEFINNLPQGLQTQIGEKGLRLSGGQRQRIAIARAILKNAPILILDEATSSLDTESERQIQAALEELMRNRTTLVIAHRLSTIENADKIVVIDDGKILEQGTHRELMIQNKVYAKLHRMQFKDEAIALAVV